jgi:16S rRNA (uracil1498-N3)-methyltransferase
LKLPRLFLPEDRVSSDDIVFDGSSARYLDHVLRLKAGDLIEAFNCSHEYIVRLSECSRKRVLGTVVEKRLAEAPGNEIILAVSCVRPDPMEQIFRHGTELGVTRFFPLISARCARKPEDKKKRWESVVAAAAAQCGRCFTPAIESVMSVAEFIDHPPEVEARMMLTPYGAPVLSFLGETSRRSFAILVGPEGGFDPSEEEPAQGAGFAPVCLGPNILRTETASIAALAIVSAHLNAGS